MNDHLTLQDLHALRFGATEPGEVLEVSRHLASCLRCSSISSETFTVIGATSFEEALRQEDHPSEEHDSRYGSETAGMAGAAIPSDRIRYNLRYALAAGVAIAVAITFWVRTVDAPLRNVVRVHAIQAAQERVSVPAPPQRSYGRGEWDSAVAAALQTNSLPRPDRFKALRPADDTLRSRTADLPAVLSPAGTSIESRRPEFSWPQSPGAEYVVTIARGNAPILSSATLTRNHWLATSDLPRNEVFRWEVEVRRPHGSPLILPAPPQPVALFHVLSEKAVSELNDARRQFPQDHLLLGVLYARHGVQARAVDELRLYAAEHPSSSTARGLVDSVQSW